MSTPPTPGYSSLLDEAVALALDAFRPIRRKGTSVPYVTHLLAVTALVGEHGGDEEQMIAAVLHDYLEDIRAATPALLEERFGERVARIVQALSDTTEHPKPPWQERKRSYIAKLAVEPAEVKLVSAADKLHNARSVLRDLRGVGDAVFERFNTGGDHKARTLWYYEAVVEALGTGWSHPLLEELRETVEGMRRLAGG